MEGEGDEKQDKKEKGSKIVLGETVPHIAGREKQRSNPRSGSCNYRYGPSTLGSLGSQQDL